MHTPEPEQLLSLGARLGRQGKDGEDKGKGKGKSQGKIVAPAYAPTPRGSIALCLPPQDHSNA